MLLFFEGLKITLPVHRKSMEEIRMDNYKQIIFNYSNFSPRKLDVPKFDFVDFQTQMKIFFNFS